MCMCSGCSAVGSDIFSKMEPGDEIKIQPGFGYPLTESEVVEIVVAVDGYSALTTPGRRLIGYDALGIELTGNRFEEGTYEISLEAQAILEEVAANRDDSDAGWDTTIKSGEDEAENWWGDEEGESWTGY